VLPHEMNRNRKPMLETVETGYSGLANWRVKFCRDQRQSGAPPGFNKVPLIRPSDVWMKKMCEPQQPKRLEWWLIDLINVKREEKKTRAKSMKSITSIDCVGVSLQSAMTYTYIGNRT
jgi:hypothetical protein